MAGDATPSVFESVVAHSPDTVILVGADGDLRYLNPISREVLGLEPGGDAPRVLSELLEPESWERWQVEAMPAATRQGEWRGELTLRRETLPALGQARVTPVEAVVVAHLGGDGLVEVLSLVARDLRAERELAAALSHRIDHDDLTGLPRRSPTLAHLERALGHADRFGTPVAVLLVDIDRFNLVNDALGHGAGDALLAAVARRLEDAARPHDRLGRLGGDEFVVICNGVDGPAEAVGLAEHVRSRVGGRFALPGDADVYVTVSVGVALADGAGEVLGSVSAEQLLRDADAAVHEAKAMGRDRVQIVDAEVRARLVRRLETEQALRHAVERGELRVHYQPIVELSSGALRGVEALVRWEHPDRGLLLPGEFLPVAEESGTVVELGRWVLTEACRAAATLGDGRLPVFVNLSPRQLADAGLVPMVREVIDLTGLGPAMLHLEITEDALLDDAGTTTEVLAELRELGVRVALDDFGTGHSSLAYLKHFPAEVLKIDRTFVEGLGEDLGDEAITEAILHVAGVLGLVTVAEGVEDESQVTRLLELGCTMAQGFHLARPVPAEQLEECLAGYQPR